MFACVCADNLNCALQINYHLSSLDKLLAFAFVDECVSECAGICLYYHLASDSFFCTLAYLNANDVYVHPM